MMKQSSIENKQQDVIIQEPELVLTALNNDQIAILNNPRYLNLIKIIHQKGPLTIAEMAEEYAEKVKDDQAKSQSTVYRYLVLLKTHNIIQETGQRVIEGKTLSQTLYSLTAKFIIVDEPEIDWETDLGRRIFKELIKFLKIFYPDKIIDEKALFQWQLRFQSIIESKRRKLINSKDPEILDILAVWAPYDIKYVMEYLGWLTVLLTDPNTQQNFLQCFNTPTELEPTSSSTIDTADNKSKYHDVIRQLPDILCILSPSDSRRRYFEKPAYIPLFHVLRDGIMTIEEIAEKYNQVTTIPKKLSTIYRYVKILKDAKLVFVAGQRVIHGKRATKKLYSPVARLFEETHDPEWKSQKRVWLLDSLLKMLSYLHPELPNADKECFNKFRVSISHFEDIEGINVYNLPKNQKAVQLLHSYDWKDFFLVYENFWDYYNFFEISDLFDRLHVCFSK